MEKWFTELFTEIQADSAVHWAVSAGRCVNVPHVRFTARVDQVRQILEVAAVTIKIAAV